MTQELTAVKKDFDIWYQDPSQLIITAAGPVPKISKETVTCSPDLICKAQLTPPSDKAPYKAMGDWFRLEDIPNTMNKMNLEVAAKLQNKWFKGEPYAMTKQEKNGSVLYSKPNLIDTTTITMSWLQGGEFPRVNQKISELRDVNYLGSELAKKALSKKLSRARLLDGRPHAGITWPGKISDSFHHNWQFQYIKVDHSWYDLLRRYISKPDDLFAALGGFELCAAIAEVSVKPLGGTRFAVTIPQIVIYARDTYDFNDLSEGSGSDYLGHWNDYGLEISLGAYRKNSDDAPLVKFIGDKPAKKNTYFCIRDKHYRQWRDKNSKGGDLLIFSDGIFCSPTSMSLLALTSEATPFIQPSMKPQSTVLQTIIDTAIDK